MARSTTVMWHMLKRLGRYRTVMEFGWQGHEKVVTGCSDSELDMCLVTGRSTSGGALMVGGHFIKGWAAPRTMSL